MLFDRVTEIEVADAQGRVTFTTIVPGCYAGRWTHIHFEVYPDAAAATNVSNQIATSQVAFPQDMLDAGAPTWNTVWPCRRSAVSAPHPTDSP